MLTFEKVLEVFKPYLVKDTICEIVTTSRGYTVMYWDGKAEDWYGVSYCKTVEAMRETLIEGYADYLEQGYTLNRRNLTDTERKEIKTVCQKLYQQCEQ